LPQGIYEVESFAAVARRAGQHAAQPRSVRGLKAARRWRPTSFSTRASRRATSNTLAAPTVGARDCNCCHGWLASGRRQQSGGGIRPRPLEDARQPARSLARRPPCWSSRSAAGLAAIRWHGRVCPCGARIHLVTDVATALPGTVASGRCRQLATDGQRWLLGVSFLLNDAVIACDAVAEPCGASWPAAAPSAMVPASVVAADFARSSSTVGTCGACGSHRRGAGPRRRRALVRPGALPSALLCSSFGSHSADCRAGQRPWRSAVEAIAADDRAFLRRLARRTWLYFETFVGPRTTGCRPTTTGESAAEWITDIADQRRPDVRFLACRVGLRLRRRAGFATRIRSGLDALDRMDRYHGHFYNWYNTRSLAALEPRYVSTVDSGNLAVCLIVLKEPAQRRHRRR